MRPFLAALCFVLAASARAGAAPDPVCTFHETSRDALTAAKVAADAAVDALANGDGATAAAALRAAAELLKEERRHLVADGRALLDPAEWKAYRKAVNVLRSTSLRTARRAVRAPA